MCLGKLQPFDIAFQMFVVLYYLGIETIRLNVTLVSYTRQIQKKLKRTSLRESIKD